ncbi:hypothetical protein PR048_026273 [Dryococelus australis]|uniref:Glycosyltransferase family 92 protein n=1 Tax=Dryococelus australis TaxID=614101 RepID=A0ABQ9GKY9_9NEOP|nr:hypothetical protein PR048_026273 [Dryococelus australis]
MKHEKSSAMKKYYQLVLIIVSVVSVVLLLFYRHEYNRLRYVLQVLNFFGKPGQSSLSTNECATVSQEKLLYTREDDTSTNPLPVWQRLTDTHYVYSAFWEDEQVKSVGLTTTNNADPKFQCQLWFDHVNQPVPGKFGFSVSSSREKKNDKLQHSKVLASYFYCKPKNNVGVPYGVEFYKTDELVPFKTFIAVHYTGKKITVANSTVICVLPDVSLPQQTSAVVEFLNYHRLIGVSNFMAYDAGIMNRISSVLSSSKTVANYGINMAFLPWNFPFPHWEAVDATSTVIEMDCMLRTSGMHRNVAVLAWNEYIVPRYHHHLGAMLDDFDSGRKTTARFEIPAIMFCSNLPDDEKSRKGAPLVLRKTHYLRGSSDEPPFHIHRPHVMSVLGDLSLTTQRVSQGIAALHRYVQCSAEDISSDKPTLYEPAMLRFSGDLMKSRFLKVWQAKKILF